MSYTPAMENAVRAAAPLNLEKAHQVASEIGVTYRSVIAKAKQLGVEYVAKPAAARKEPTPRKAEYVKAIQIMTGLQLDGLDKAPTKTLVELSDWLANLAMGKSQ